MSEQINVDVDPEQQDVHEPTAMRVYAGADGAQDFPVLKAFQEYLAAEQAKANKRMLALSIFFVILLMIVVLTFTLITWSMINRNQALSDRLMDIALQNRTAQPQPAMAAPVVNVQQPAVQPADASKSVQPILEKLAALESELAKARAQSAEARPAPAAETVPTASEAGKTPSRTPAGKSEPTSEAAKKEVEELLKQQAAVKAAREQLKAEQEELHKAQVEQQRRRLYPEYYAKEDARRAAEEAAKNPPEGEAAPAGDTEKAAATPPSPEAAPAGNASLPSVQPQQPAPAVEEKKPQPRKKTLQEILDEDDAVSAPQPAAEKPKKSALQAILDEDDAGQSAGRLSDEEAKKLDDELKNLLDSVDKADAAAASKKPAEVGQDAPSTPPSAESIDVGAKDGKKIPWLGEIPGEEPVENRDANSK